MGRPKLNIDPAMVEKLAAIFCTKKEISVLLGCSEDTIGRNFAEIYEKGRENGKMSLRRAQMQLALKGNATMCIFLGKQLLGQIDEQTLNVKSLQEQVLKAIEAHDVSE